MEIFTGLQERIKADQRARFKADYKKKIDDRATVCDGARINMEQWARNSIPVQDITKCRPVNNRVIVKFFDTAIDKQSGIIFIPEHIRKDIQVSQVVRMPSTCSRKYYEHLDTFKNGDYCIVPKQFVGFPIRDMLTGQLYMSIHLGTMLAKIDPDEISKIQPTCNGIRGNA